MVQVRKYLKKKNISHKNPEILKINSIASVVKCLMHNDDCVILQYANLKARHAIVMDAFMFIQKLQSRNCMGGLYIYDPILSHWMDDVSSSETLKCWAI